MCSKGCCEVGTYIYGKNSTFFEDEDKDHDNDTIIQYEAFKALYNDGHPHYILPAYCVEIGHIECLKKIAKEEQFMYHSDLAQIAIEHDNLECLQYIVEDLGDVNVDIDINNVGQHCKEYVCNIKKNKKKEEKNTRKKEKKRIT